MSRGYLSRSSRDFDPEAALEQGLLSGCPIRSRAKEGPTPRLVLRTGSEEAVPLIPPDVDIPEAEEAIDDFNMVIEQAEAMVAEAISVNEEDQVETPPPTHDEAPEPASQTSSPPKAPIPELPPRGEIARLGSRGAGKAPKRIGRGTLAPARITWKPGDPFGDSEEAPSKRFRWERMLASACVTAACGLLCVWLLRSILA